MPKIPAAEEWTLSNGIPVIVQHQDAPVAATYWWVRTGSADESAREAGFAHFLEHMLFKDAAAKETGRASTGQLAQAIESLGGDINAYTSFDQTVYHVTCAAHHWEKVIDSFGQMAKPQRFLKDDFAREREVILEELKKNNDSPSRQVSQAMFSGAFSKHPYGRPVIGYPRTLKAATVSDLERFYRRNYVAKNMGLVLVGPFGEPGSPRRKRVLKLLEKRFGRKAIPAGQAARPAPRSQEKTLRSAPSVSQKAFDVKTPTLSIVFRAPDLLHPDVAALEVLSSILGAGELSRLYQRLFYRDSLVTEASGGLYVPRDPGMMYFQAEFESIDRTEAVVRAIFEEFGRLREEGPSREEIARVLVNAESERLYATQTADGMASRLGFLRFTVNDMGFDESFLEALREVDAERVKQVAREYLDPRRMSVFLLRPEESKEVALERMVRDAIEASGVAHAPQSPKAKPRARASSTQGLLQHLTTDSGIRVVFRPNPTSHVVSVYSSMFGGLRSELATPVTTPDQDWGSSSLMSQTWTKGTAQGPWGDGRNAQAIAAEFEGRAASIDGFSGRNTTGLQMTGLARDWPALGRLFAEIWWGASFPDDELAHSKRVAEDSIRGIADHSGSLCSELFLKTLFERHPYGRTTLGSLESIASIDSARLREFRRRWQDPKRTVVAVAGNLRRGELEQWAQQLDSWASALGSSKASALPQLEDEAALAAPRWIEKSMGREQQHIIVGGLGVRVDSPERHALRLLGNVLGGQSGRLFIELREKKSLAYTVSPISMEGLERGYVGTYIACSPSKRDEAVAGIRSVLEKVAKDGPSEKEMSRAREFLLGRHAMDLQSDPSRAAFDALNELYGLGHRSADEESRRIRGITAKQVRDACRKYLVEPHHVTAVVG